jgi:L-rhamnonate dehydratase
MRIVSVRTFQPIAPNSPPDWRTSLGQIAVRIETDVGLVGMGVGGGGAAGRHVIDAVLAPWLVGQEVEPIETRWEEMYRATLPFGRKGIAVMALSGVDLALWDLRAKAAGLSIAAWLAADGPASVPVYTTVWHEVDPLTASGQGPGGTGPVKLHVEIGDSREPVRDVVRQVQAARAALGPDRPLMIDAWMKWDVDLTLRIAERLVPLGIDWIEEPLSPDDLAGYERLSRDCPLPIAGGEHEFTAAAFRELIDRRLHSILQPDVCWVGGMTELVKIYRLAEAAGVRVVPHRGAEVWALPAIAALDRRTPLAESGRPWMTWVRGQPPLLAGRIAVPTGPGFGVWLEETPAAAGMTSQT